jgi:hypothetical protein
MFPTRDPAQGSDLTGSCCRSSLSVSIRAPAQGATVARESILIPMNPRSRTGATAVVEGYAMDASMAAFCGVGGRRLDITTKSCFSMVLLDGRDLGLVLVGPDRVSEWCPANAKRSPTRRNR